MPDDVSPTGVGDIVVNRDDAVARCDISLAAEAEPPPPPSSGYVRFANMLSSLADSASAARAPLFVAIAFWLAMLLPDQTDQALRVMVDPEEPWTGTLFGWLLLCGVLGGQMLFAGLYAFGAIEGQPMHDRNRRPIDRFLFAYIMATPCLAAGSALARASDAGMTGPWIATVGLVLATMIRDGEALQRTPWLRACAIGCYRLGWLLILIGAALLLFGEGARAAALFVFCGAAAGAFWSHFDFSKHPRRRVGFVVACALVGLALILYVLVILLGTPPAPFYLTLWFTLLLPAMLLSALAREHWHLRPLTLAVMLAVLLSLLDWNDNHTVRHRARGVTVPAGAEVGQTADRSNSPAPAEARQAFAGWLDALDRRGAWTPGRRPVFLVAAEGGGLRAAYWTALVLEELRARHPENFAQHTFVLAGVSGGSVGAAAYAAGLHEVASVGTPPEDGRPQGAGARSVAALRADLLSPLLRGLLEADLPARVVPAFLADGLDRARWIEDVFNKAWQDAGGASIVDLHMQDIRPDPVRGVPHLLLLTTSVETGHRMAVGHLRLPLPPDVAEVSPGGCRVLEPAAAPEAAARLWNLAEEAPGIDLPLATAAMLSARFPILTPAGTLPCGNGVRRRFVDGGYFENSGVTTLLDLIAELREDAAARNVRLVVIRIANSRATINAATRAGHAPKPPDHSFGELMSPVRSLLGTRQARGELAVVSLDRVAEQANAACAVAEAARRAGQAAAPCVPIDDIAFALAPNQVAIPLGWWLSEPARLDMERQLTAGENARSLERIADLLAGASPR
jgi:hypothetical protein